MSNWSKWKEAVGLDALDYPIPTHANTIWYSLGGITLVCFVITIVTGIILTQFYNPNPTIAHASVGYISDTAGLKIIRSLHHWGANLGFLLVIAHMVRVMLTGAYRPPRVITYLVGVGLLFVSFNSYFTGTVIRWDQEGYEALSHFMAMNKLMGPLGAVFQEDFTLSTSMLARVYGLHVGLFPLLLVLLIGLHALYVKHYGVAPKPFQNEKDYQTSLAQGATFMKHLNKLTVYGAILLIVILALAFLFPPGLLKAPVPGVEMTKPPWPFWAFYPLENLMGIAGILVGSFVIFAGLILVPILGFAMGDEKKLFKVVRTITILGLIAWAASLVITYFSPVMSHM